MEELFKSGTVSFDEFDDVVVRRLVECIWVMADKRINVVLKDKKLNRKLKGFWGRKPSVCFLSFRTFNNWRE